MSVTGLTAQVETDRDAFAGATEGFVHREHHVRDLDWATAKENFYAATLDGLDADLTWVTADGTRTTDTGEFVDWSGRSTAR